MSHQAPKSFSLKVNHAYLRQISAAKASIRKQIELQTSRQTASNKNGWRDFGGQQIDVYSTDQSRCARGGSGRSGSSAC